MFDPVQNLDLPAAPVRTPADFRDADQADRDRLFWARVARDLNEGNDDAD